MLRPKNVEMLVRSFTLKSTFRLSNMAYDTWTTLTDKLDGLSRSSFDLPLLDRFRYCGQPLTPEYLAGSSRRDKENKKTCSSPRCSQVFASVLQPGQESSASFSRGNEWRVRVSLRIQRRGIMPSFATPVERCVPRDNGAIHSLGEQWVRNAKELHVYICQVAEPPLSRQRRTLSVSSLRLSFLNSSGRVLKNPWVGEPAHGNPRRNAYSRWTREADTPVALRAPYRSSSSFSIPRCFTLLFRDRPTEPTGHPGRFDRFHGFLEIHRRPTSHVDASVSSDIHDFFDIGRATASFRLFKYLRGAISSWSISITNMVH